jgi:acetyl esterase/lipase
MNPLLTFFSITLNLFALLSVVWIIVPAPAYHIWLFSVATSEWSLWFGALALIGIGCASFALLFYGKSKLLILSLLIGGIALIISLYPPLSVLALAKEHNVSLSLSAYFGGVKNVDNSPENTKTNFTTRTFARADNQDLQMDIFPPIEKTTNNGAGIIVVHGGSWNAGGRNDFPQWNEWLAAQGYTVFDVDYRLAPQPNYLTATGDVKHAILWVKEHATEFNVSPDRIAVFGRSAGAHLALLAAYSADDQRLPATDSNLEINEQVRAVVSFYAPVDLLWGFDNPANPRVINGQQTLANFLGGNPHDSAEIRNRFILTSPTSHVNTNTPPTLLFHGGQDQLVRAENMRRLADKLNESKVPHKTIFIPYAQHGFDFNFNGWAAQISKSVMLDFIHEHTRPNQKPNGL